MRTNLFLTGIAALLLCLTVHAQDSGPTDGNCGLTFYPDFFSAGNYNGWQPYYTSDAGPCYCAAYDRHVPYSLSLTDGMTNSNVTTLRPGCDNSLRIGKGESYQWISEVTYAGEVGVDLQYLLVNYALVGSQYKDQGSLANFYYICSIQPPGSSPTTISISPVYPTSLPYTGVQDISTDHSDHTNVYYQKWKSILFDFTAYPAGTIINLKFHVEDDQSSEWKGRFMYAYLDAECIGGRWTNAAAQICSGASYSFFNDLASNTTDQITHQWSFGDGTYSTEVSPSHAFPPSTQDGSGNYVPYHVNLVLTLPNGQGGTTTSTIHIKDITVVPTISGEITDANTNCGKWETHTFSHPATANEGESWVWDFGDGSPTSTDASPSHVYGAVGTYEVTLTFTPNSDMCGRTVQTVAEIKNCPVDCEDCITKFSLPPGDYILSAWVKEEASPLTTSYSHAKIEVQTGITQTLGPGGPIIDGWQRIEGVFEITNDDPFSIKLKTTTMPAYFDDIRIFPYDGSMMSYVYDPNTLRLMAELDERNYARFYEYDEEGKLVRVKKETENGVMTIQENVENSSGL